MGLYRTIKVYILLGEYSSWDGFPGEKNYFNLLFAKRGRNRGDRGMNKKMETPDCYGMMDIHYGDGDCLGCPFTGECVEFTNKSIDGCEP